MADDLQHIRSQEKGDIRPCLVGPDMWGSLETEHEIVSLKFPSGHTSETLSPLRRVSGFAHSQLWALPCRAAFAIV